MNQDYFDNLVNVYSNCIEELKGDNVILNSEFWLSLKQFYAGCIFINFKNAESLSNIAKQSPSLLIMARYRLCQRDIN
jgi:hypothetical protein